MASNKPVWNGDEFLVMLRALILQRLDKACIYLVAKVKKKLSVTGVGQAIVAHTQVILWGQWKHPGARVVFSKKDAAAYISSMGKRVFSAIRYRKRQRIYGFVRSLPGEPPRKQYGTLRASITYEIDTAIFVARVGTNYLIAKFLELGTVKMAARPFLRSTAFEESANIGKIMGGKMKFNGIGGEVAA